MACKMNAYFRVSTTKQATSGLGLDAQEATVAAYVASAGCDLIASYTEVENGKKHDLVNRPELAKAVAHARRAKAVLVVAKLDRLLRSTVVLTMLKTSGVRFVACDNKRERVHDRHSGGCSGERGASDLRAHEARSRCLEGPRNRSWRLAPRPPEADPRNGAQGR
jgi:hypothetical protein